MTRKPPPATTPRPEDVARLHGPWLALARFGVIAYGLTFLILFIVGTPVHFRALTTVCSPIETCRLLNLSPPEVAAMPPWLGLEAYAVYQIAVESVLAAVGLSVAILIVLRLSHTRMGLLAAAATIWVAFAGESFGALAEAVPLVAAIYWPTVYEGIVLIWLFVLLFPDGRAEPPWFRRRFPLFLLAMVGLQAWGLLVQTLELSNQEAPYFVLFLAIILFSFVIQVIRYRRHTTPEQRQQVKWGVVGLASLVVAFFLYASLDPTISPVATGRPRLAWNLLGMLLLATAGALFPITLAYSILRRRLWDIDQIINRALVYGTLTVILTSIYLGTVVLLQRVVLSGQGSSLVVAGSTLLIAALFAPLRRRIQTLIDRRFYRSKYDSQRALAAFAATARSQVDLDALTAELLRVVGDTVQPQQVSLWLKPEQERPSRVFEASSRHVP